MKKLLLILSTFITLSSQSSAQSTYTGVVVDTGFAYDAFWLPGGRSLSNNYFYNILDLQNKTYIQLQGTTGPAAWLGVSQSTYREYALDSEYIPKIHDLLVEVDSSTIRSLRVLNDLDSVSQRIARIKLVSASVTTGTPIAIPANACLINGMTTAGIHAVLGSYVSTTLTQLEQGLVQGQITQQSLNWFTLHGVATHNITPSFTGIIWWMQFD